MSNGVNAMSIPAWSLALLLFTSSAMAQPPTPAPAEQAQAVAPDKDPDKAAEQDADKGEELPELRIACVRVFDHQDFILEKPKDPGSQSKKVTDASEVNCPAPERQTLVGAGDVVIVLDPQTYKTLETHQEKKGAKATLFINGVDLGDDAELIGVQRFVDRSVLQYRIRPGENSKRLWAAIYRSGKVTTPHPLNAALGFATGPATVGTTGGSAKIAITSKLSFWLAMGAITLLVLAALDQGRRTDIFRDAKTPPPFARAWAARKELDGSAEKEEKILKGLDPAYTPADRPAYVTVAEQALNGDLKDLDPNKLAAGLVLVRDRWHSKRPSYSLGRVQLGMWFVFAVATGVFLWLIYGDLPELDGSVLALLGVSLGVTGVSLAIDSNNPNVRFSPSNGLFKDMITSWDDQHQVYRFQAVVVNLLLLLVGIIHVSRHLTYPIFDATWLAFLGISGAALAAGKSVVESKESTPPATTSTPPAQ